MSAILAIDTPSDGFAIGLGRDGAEPLVIVHARGQEHSQQLAAAIDRLIEGKREAIGGIVVTAGPGHFAGLRVGIATAEGLSLALGVPLAGVSTLRLAAAASGIDAVLAVHTAGRGEFAVQAYRGDRAESEMALATPAELEGKPVAGEGAGALGGIEVGPEQRVRAAFALPFEPSPDGLVVPIYAREPHITRSRRRIAGAGHDRREP